MRHGQASKGDGPRAAPRPVVVRRGTLIAALATGALALSWAAGATWYILSKDELAQRFFALETEMKYGYEDRIAALGQRLEREVTLNLVERTGFQARAELIAKRQAEIEARQGWLRNVAERVMGSALDNRATGSSIIVGPPSRPADRPAPLADDAGFKLRESAAPAEDIGQRAPDRLSAVESSIERISSEGTGVLKALSQGTRSRVSRLRSALDATGLDIDHARPPKDATGGPLVPLPDEPKKGPFAFLAEDLEISFSELTRLTATVKSLPLRAPLAGELEQTSAFGYRLDPFTRSPALHTGLDFRAEIGTPATATGAGRVVAAEYTGGYGLMVEIDHGGGLSTRYGHLSAVTVAPGERVEAGRVIGRTGSSGRSTGAHLHYETRVNGQPVNPSRFLAFARLAAEHGG